MPIYIYKHPSEEIYREVLQSMNDVHEYFEDGTQWNRVFLVPNASIDSSINPYSQNDFVNKTANKKGTMGDLMDLSAELSAKRASSAGEDPIKRNFFDDYSKKNNGKKHLLDKPKTIETKNFKIDL
jgi:hypothetical protein